MKRVVLTAISFFAFVLIAAAPVHAACAKIKDGSITDSAGNVLTLGYDQYGYNYQAHMFNGTYDSVDRKLDGMYYGQTGDFVNDSLIMKWSDDWLANVDCDDDHKLDRGLDSRTGIFSGTSMGWETNQVEGDYVGDDGDSHHFTYFAKIVYDGGTACSTPGNPACLWGVYTIIEEVYNDPYGGYHGVDHSKLVKPEGFGVWTK